MASSKPKLVDKFEEGEHPHQHVHKTLSFAPMVRLKCNCGYDGLATWDKENDVPICPSEVLHKEQYNSTQDRIVNEEKAPAAVNELVAAAVAKQMQPMQDMIAKLSAQLEEKNSEEKQKNNKPKEVPVKDVPVIDKKSFDEGSK